MSLPLLVTPGMGIGPEVTLRALALDGHDDVVLVGRVAAIEEANQEVGLPLQRVDEPAVLSGSLAIHEPEAQAEPVEVASVRLAAERCLAGAAAGLVTGPIHKRRLVDQGFSFRGHTDFLGALCGVSDPVMAFVGGELRVALVTHDRPLMSVGGALTPALIEGVVRVAASALEADLGLKAPRIAVCGLNPHAGEEGLLGREEIECIGPACAQLRGAGLDVVGPVSAETAFLEARAGRVALVVAMYHDQGLAPLKAVDFGRSVNWTLGLPILRTSVDHGTADALVGTGRADPSSMRAALGLARKVISRRRPPR